MKTTCIILFDLTNQKLVLEKNFVVKPPFFNDSCDEFYREFSIFENVCELKRCALLVLYTAGGLLILRITGGSQRAGLLEFLILKELLRVGFVTTLVVAPLKEIWDCGIEVLFGNLFHRRPPNGSLIDGFGPAHF